MAKPDVRILWLNVHGGAFHKLLTLQEELGRRGIACELIIACGPPRGLKIGVDVPQERLGELAARGAYFLPRDEALARALASPAHLLVTDAHHDADLPKVIAKAAGQGMLTAQMATLLHDFSCHGARHVLLQHPLTLFYELEYHRTKESSRFREADGIHFTGNIFYEPTVNPLHGGFNGREDFCAKYGFDPSRPICLWLPNYADVKDQTYGRIIETAAQARVNLAVKLHPWEYAFKKHGTDTWGFGASSDDLWGVRAVDEADSSWAYFFCDLAVMRTSATCLEMPFWRKPSALLPSTAYPGIIGPQTRMVERCSVRLLGPDELPALLGGLPPVFAEQDYDSARAQVRQDITRDAYAQTVDTLAAILRNPTHGKRTGNLLDLYDSHVADWIVSGLPPLRRARFMAARTWLRLGGCFGLRPL